MAERAEEAKKKADEEEITSNKQQSKGQNEHLTVFRSGVGKYINVEASRQWVFYVYYIGNMILVSRWPTVGKSFFL